MNRYDNDIPVNGGFRAKNYSRSDGEGFYQVLKTNTRTFKDSGITVFDLDCEYEINPDDFKSMGKSSPFTGDQVFGENLLTVVNGKAINALKSKLMAFVYLFF